MSFDKYFAEYRDLYPDRLITAAGLQSQAGEIIPIISELLEDRPAVFVIDVVKHLAIDRKVAIHGVSQGLLTLLEIGEEYRIQTATLGEALRRIYTAEVEFRNLKRLSKDKIISTRMQLLYNDQNSLDAYLREHSSMLLGTVVYDVESLRES